MNLQPPLKTSVVFLILVFKQDKKMEANMNIKQILPVFMVGLFITTAGICDTFIRCIPKTASSCSNPTYPVSGSQGGGVQWSATCNTGTGQTKFKGLAICAANATSPALDLTYTSGSNTTCWCKIITPADSKWVTGGHSSSETSCNDTCAQMCANGATGSSTVVSRALQALI